MEDKDVVEMLLGGDMGLSKEVTSGPGGKCKCTKCSNTVAHTRGKPCTSIKCSKCGASMTRA